MTKEETIKILSDECYNPQSWHLRSPEREDASNMAIKILERPECEDAVSRAAVMDILYLDPGITVEQEKMIKQLPSVMPKSKPRIGKWISQPYQADRECSVCGYTEPYKFADKEAEIYHYCPHCGVMMKSE